MIFSMLTPQQLSHPFPMGNGTYFPQWNQPINYQNQVNCFPINYQHSFQYNGQQSWYSEPPIQHHQGYRRFVRIIEGNKSITIQKHDQQPQNHSFAAAQVNSTFSEIQTSSESVPQEQDMIQACDEEMNKMEANCKFQYQIPKNQVGDAILSTNRNCIDTVIRQNKSLDVEEETDNNSSSNEKKYLNPRKDVIFKTILRDLRKFYLESFNLMTQYSRNKRYQNPTFYIECLRDFLMESFTDRATDINVSYQKLTTANPSSQDNLIKFMGCLLYPKEMLRFINSQAKAPGSTSINSIVDEDEKYHYFEIHQNLYKFSNLKLKALVINENFAYLFNHYYSIGIKQEQRLRRKANTSFTLSNYNAVCKYLLNKTQKSRKKSTRSMSPQNSKFENKNGDRGSPSQEVYQQNQKTSYSNVILAIDEEDKNTEVITTKSTMVTLDLGKKVINF